MDILVTVSSISSANQITDGIVTKAKLATDAVNFIAAMALLSGD